MIGSALTTTIDEKIVALRKQDMPPEDFKLAARITAYEVLHKALIACHQGIAAADQKMVKAIEKIKMKRLQRMEECAIRSVRESLKKNDA